MATIDFLNFFFAQEGTLVSAPSPPPPPAGTITHDEMQFNINNAGVGGTVDMLGEIVDVTGRPLALNQAITIVNGTIRRAVTPIATLLTKVDAGSNSVFEVDDATGFEPGYWVMLSTGVKFNENHGAQIFSIQSKNGNIITINAGQPVVNAIPAGAIATLAFPLVRQNPGPDTFVSILDSLVFDGNKANNNQTLDWRYNHTTSIGLGDIVTKCTFQNTPGENLFVADGSIVEDCEGNELNGSFVHFSNPSSPTLPPIGTIIRRNTGTNSCLTPNHDNGHDSGVFEYSNNASNLLMEDNVFSNGREGVFGSQASDDNASGLNIARRNTWTNFKRIQSVGGGPVMDTSNDTFIDVPNTHPVFQTGGAFVDDANPNDIRIPFSENLNPANIPDLSDFKVIRIDGQTFGLVVSVGTDYVNLSLNANVEHGNGGIIVYEKGTTPILGVSGEEVDNFETAINNNIAAPVFVSAKAITQNGVGANEIRVLFDAPASGNQLMGGNYSFTMTAPNVAPWPLVTAVNQTSAIAEPVGANEVVLHLDGSLLASLGNGTISCGGHFINEILVNGIIG